MDEAVNQPMVEEMFRLIGYHLPVDIASRPVKDLETLCSLLKMFSVEGLKKMTFCEVRSITYVLLLLINVQFFQRSCMTKYLPKKIWRNRHISTR